RSSGGGPQVYSSSDGSSISSTRPGGISGTPGEGRYSTAPPARGSSSNGVGCQASSSPRSVNARHTRSGEWASSRSKRSTERPSRSSSTACSAGIALSLLVEVVFQRAEPALPQQHIGGQPSRELGEPFAAQAVQ